MYLEGGGGGYGGGTSGGRAGGGASRSYPVMMGQWAVGSDRPCAGQRCGSSGMRRKADSAWTRAACR